MSVDTKIPRDPAMLLSFINLKLRDCYSSLDALCDDMQIEREEICTRLAMIDYVYDPGINQFV